MKEKVGQGFFSRIVSKFSNPDSKKKQIPPPNILPENVRYALSYKEGQMGKNEITSLLENGYVAEAMYLTSKILAHDSEKHFNFISSLVQNPEEIEVSILNSLKDGDIKTTQGKKIAQFSRQGFDTWGEKFKMAAKEMSLKEAETVLIAHSIVAGLAYFISEFKQQRRQFYMLVSEWIADDAQENWGYEVKPGEKEVTFLSKKEKRPEHVVFVDDAYNTGVHMREVWKFWYKDEKPINFEQLCIVQGLNPQKVAV